MKDKVTTPVANERIKAEKVQLIDQSGENRGVVSRDLALREARDAGLDLILIADRGAEGLPVVKIMDMGKALYLKKKKAASAKKKQVIINSDGQVFPCISESYLTSNNYGNIKEESFKNILRRLKFFKCSLPPNSSCWDHFLWDRLAKKLEKEENFEA